MRNRNASQEFDQDLASIEAFAEFRTNLNPTPETPTGNLRKLGYGVISACHIVAQTILDTQVKDKIAAKKLELHYAEQAMDNGYITEQQLNVLTTNKIGVIIFPFRQQN